MSPANDDRAQTTPLLPIRVSTARTRLRITYVCETLAWAGQKLRDFHAVGDRPIRAHDATGRGLSGGEIAVLLALPGPYDRGLDAVA